MVYRFRAGWRELPKSLIKAASKLARRKTRLTYICLTCKYGSLLPSFLSLPRGQSLGTSRWSDKTQFPRSVRGLNVLTLVVNRRDASSLTCISISLARFPGAEFPSPIYILWQRDSRKYFPAVRVCFTISAIWRRGRARPLSRVFSLSFSLFSFYPPPPPVDTVVRITVFRRATFWNYAKPCYTVFLSFSLSSSGNTKCRHAV